MIHLRANYALLLAVALCLAGGATGQQSGKQAEPPRPDPMPRVGEWQSMFDGKTLGGWKETPFTARGTVTIEDGTIILGPGLMTGINWTRWFPKSNYEIRMEAARLKGYDFFAGITFPVFDTFCSWINGGWNGNVVGLSNLDGSDAAENETSFQKEFELKRYYKLRLQVTDRYINAWIDDQPAISVDMTGRTIDLRYGEIDLSRPLGIASYETTAGIRKIEYRLIDPNNPGQ